MQNRRHNYSPKLSFENSWKIVKLVGYVTQIFALELTILSNIQKNLFDTKLVTSRFFILHFYEVNIFWPFSTIISLVISHPYTFYI